jgi:hypothetical protein
VLSKALCGLRPCCGAVFCAQRQGLSRELSHIVPPSHTGFGGFSARRRVLYGGSRLLPASGATSVDTHTDQFSIFSFFGVEFFEGRINAPLIPRSYSRVIFNLRAGYSCGRLNSLPRVQINPPTFLTIIAA